MGRTLEGHPLLTSSCSHLSRRQSATTAGALHDRHRRWSAEGTWDGILWAVQAGADAEGRID
ncbi:predicted protein [Streptomyces viridosporus ATCC 14672]|uniref:Predicted protein n=1 Tax=Streptomyces viridosporus (strain ATCC 14672 / DSM 40746 / JCM 4963 / KCTC 9882 / NRRL B-12104 / FH 1290) TaxID=566461 RepID=D6A254_STRV1|nr:predicted protein [Streptomyces viridosporus ATCC 14672]